MKKLTALILCMILLTLTSTAISTSADSPRIVYGQVYIDGVLAPNGVTVKLTVPSVGELTTDTYENGNYIFNFWGEDYEECTFSILYSSIWYTPTPSYVDLGEDIEHNVDLYIETEIPTKTSFLIGKITNLNAEGNYIKFEALNIRYIHFFPFAFMPYSSSEQVIISKDYIGLVGVRYIFALCDAVIEET